ncbi:lysine/ornithine N-monooxygenase, partial [Undibacterium sp. GrIS 1.2]|uniref:SidA/IucD/PvdA family monooxygenase n=1 Tax=Undibacterium sp. GrIS 1.2 TaxID=3143933 RepID=UPI00339A53AF
MAQCLGIGIGPANLSLACHLADDGVKALFFDRSAQFGWHEGMQIEGANLQVSLFKDLVTLANPSSAYTFLTYLHQQGRLGHFINARFDAVSRREFAHYLSWVCSQIKGLEFGTDVQEVDHDGTFIVRTSGGDFRSPNVVFGVGKVPAFPDFIHQAPDDYLFHSADFTWRGKNLGQRSVAVIGGGQSGAEIFLDLISRCGPNRPSHITWISSRANFLPMDDSPFTNDMCMRPTDPPRRSANNRFCPQRKQFINTIIFTG